jgi:DNA-binding LacI/PurR family transcriptional regulator
MATLREVADKAGVSISTASRALSGDASRPVAAATQKRIWDVVRQLGYEPNDSAVHLVRHVEGQVRRTYTVGLVLGNVSYKFADPFWSLVLQGIDKELVRQQYHLRFAFSLEDLARPHQLRVLNRARIDGMILVGCEPPFPAEVMHERTILVNGYEGDEPLRFDVVTMEKRRAIYGVVEHLAHLGRRRIGFLGPAPAQDERADAFMPALLRCDLAFNPDLVVHTPWTAEGAYLRALELLAAHAASVDALVCGCDTIAIGAMRAAKECGLRLPEDLAIVGFDNIPFACDLEPPLTTVHVPKELMGELAVRRLIERIAEPDLPPIIQMAPTRLVVRGSCGAQMGTPGSTAKEMEVMP